MRDLNLQFSMGNNHFQGELSHGPIRVSGNEMYGYRPGELLVTSVAVCSGGVLRKILEKKRLNVEDITIKVAATRNEQEANRIENIHIHFVIKGPSLSEEKLAKAIELASKNCEMVQSVKGSIGIKETFELIS